MKYLSFLVLLFGTTTLAQTIQNPGFENPTGIDRALPADWKVAGKPGYTITLDSTSYPGPEARHRQKVGFAMLSKTGGIVNLYEAMKLVEQAETKK